MDMGKYRNLVDLSHALKCVNQLEKIQSKRPLLEKEIQEKYYWQSRVEDEYAKPCRPRDNKKEYKLLLIATWLLFATTMTLWSCLLAFAPIYSDNTKSIIVSLLGGCLVGLILLGSLTYIYKKHNLK